MEIFVCSTFKTTLFVRDIATIDLPNMPQYLFVAICMLLQLYCLAMQFFM